MRVALQQYSQLFVQCACRVHTPGCEAGDSRIVQPICFYHLHDMQALLCLLLIWFACKTSHHCHLQLSYVLLKGITAKHHSKDSCRVHKLFICQACFAILVIPAAQLQTCNHMLHCCL